MMISGTDKKSDPYDFKKYVNVLILQMSCRDISGFKQQL